MRVVLIVASGAGWESEALALLNAHPGIVVLKRCVDVDDLLAAASAGQADVAVLALDSPGLDTAAVDHLRRHDVRPVAIVSGLGATAALDAGRLRASRIGIATVVADADLHSLPIAVTATDLDLDPAAPVATDVFDDSSPVPASGSVAVTNRGRVIVVWGPAGAPGRTTLASGIAAELARRRLRTVLIDADPYGGSIAQQLGILDEASGLLAATRLATGGVLAERFAEVQRAIDSKLSVITGLPRPDRWIEVRPGALEHVLEVAREHGEVVVDAGFSLEEDPGQDFGSRPARNQMTLGAIDVADEVVVVGSADPVGLSRLARGLVELRERTADVPVRVVVNRMRPTLGWAERDIAGMVSGMARLSGLHFLPDDRAGVDRALVSGRTLIESGESPIVRGIAAIVDALAPPPPPQPRPELVGVRQRTTGRARPR